MQLLVSLHDVTPAHRGRLDRAEALFAEAGVTRVSYLLVPDYHRRYPVQADVEFARWCRRGRPFRVDWVLHGYFHLEDIASRGAGDQLARTLMTAGEGEFLALDAIEQWGRLRAGQAVARRVLGVTPRAFVAPAWLFNQALRPALADLGFRYTEDHLRVFDVRTGATRLCPAVTWATRTFVRRVGSRVVCPLALWALSGQRALRIAIHPHDLDHPKTAAQIRRLLRTAIDGRSAVGYDELFGVAPETP